MIRILLDKLSKLAGRGPIILHMIIGVGTPKQRLNPYLSIRHFFIQRLKNFLSFIISLITVLYPSLLETLFPFYRRFHIRHLSGRFVGLNATGISSIRLVGFTQQGIDASAPVQRISFSGQRKQHFYGFGIVAHFKVCHRPLVIGLLYPWPFAELIAKVAE